MSSAECLQMQHWLVPVFERVPLLAMCAADMQVVIGVM